MQYSDPYLEAQPGFNAAGSPVPENPDDRCGNTIIRGYSTVLDCVLLRGHEGAHEAMIGSSWLSEKEQ